MKCVPGMECFSLYLEIAKKDCGPAISNISIRRGMVRDDHLESEYLRTDAFGW
jgi:hypothetical protein